MNTPTLNGFLQDHHNGCDFYSKEPCSCGKEAARAELAQLKAELAAKTEAVEKLLIVLGSLSRYQKIFKRNTGENFPGNKYYSSAAMRIVDNANAIIAKYGKEQKG